MTGRTEREVVIPAPRAHGGDAVILARALGVDPDAILDLSMTLNPLAGDVAALVRRSAGAIRRYPDADTATRVLAEAIGVGADRLLVTNGGAEAIALVAAELGAATVTGPEFSLWRRHLASESLVGDQSTAGRVRSNPNNPTGMLAGEDEIAQCWDEAFYPLATGRWTRGDFERGAIVVGSLTKLFACPGLRLGYVVAPDAVFRDRLERRQPMWSVNALALEILPTLVASARLVEWAGEISSLSGSFATLFRTRGFRVTATDAPWVLVRGASWLREALARHSILVRDCSNFGLEDTLRIAIPRSQEFARVGLALDRALEVRR